jgi:HEAT repeat protein
MELKLMALNSLMHGDEDEAVPLLEEVLKSDQPTKVKERALFVLAQSGSNRAFDVVARIARNNADPELQEKAIQYIGIHGRRENVALLSELYNTVASVETKKAILHSFMVAGEKGRLLQAATGEKDPELRGAAIHWLGVMDAENEVWDLYERESSIEVKKKILHALFVGDGSDRLLAVAQNRSEPEELRLQAIHWLGVNDRDEELWTIFQNESSTEVKKQILHGLFLSDSVDKLSQVARDSSQSVELRKAAIHNLGISGHGSRPLLLEIYNGESDTELKKQVLHALFLQDAATELIDIARKETDLGLKKQAVHWLSLTDSPEAKQFLLELIKK